MATSIKFLRSSVAQLRPEPGLLAEGLPLINYNETEPGLFFKARDGSLIKIGTASVGPEAPNSSPAGYAGNVKGELWVDNSGAKPLLKVYDGSSWLTVSGLINGADIINGTVTRNKLATDTRIQKLDSIAASFNGVTAGFNITIGGNSVTPEYENAIMVFLGGIAQEPGIDFTVAGSTLTFTTPPATGLSFFAYYM